MRVKSIIIYSILVIQTSSVGNTDISSFDNSQYVICFFTLVSSKKEKTKKLSYSWNSLGILIHVGVPDKENN